LPDILEVDDLRSGYGRVPVLHGVSFAIGAGEVAVILGLNGAGKSTTVKVLCGALPVWSGRVSYDGNDLSQWKTAQCVKAGIVMVPEGRRVFGDLSVEKNLQVGAWSQRHSHGWEAEQREQVYEYLPRLSERRSQLAGTLSGGEQQMLAIGRGLMANPRLLIIDEASLGLAPVIVNEVYRHVEGIVASGVTLLLVEENFSHVRTFDARVLLLESGRIVREGSVAELLEDEIVMATYLGT